MASIPAEKRADGVFVAAGVELVEPEKLWRSPYGREWVDPPHVTRLNERLRWETATRLRAAIADKLAGYGAFRMPLVLKTCRHCRTALVGLPSTRLCPACKHKAALASSRASAHRLRAKRREALDLHCRQCGAPLAAKRSTKAFCSAKCRVAARREARSKAPPPHAAP
jgi:hypothetical protein